MFGRAASGDGRYLFDLVPQMLRRGVDIQTVLLFAAQYRLDGTTLIVFYYVCVCVLYVYYCLCMFMCCLLTSFYMFITVYTCLFPFIC